MPCPIASLRRSRAFFEMNGEQHPARFLRRDVVKHAGTEHQNLLRVQMVRLRAGFTLDFNRQRAVKGVNRHQTIGFVVSQCAAGFKGKENDGRRVAVKNRHLAMPVSSQMRLVEQVRAHFEQVESVLRPAKTRRRGLAQARR